MDRGLVGIKSQSAALTFPSMFSSHCHQHRLHHSHTSSSPSSSSLALSARRTKTSSFATAVSELVLSPTSIPLRHRQRCPRSFHTSASPAASSSATEETLATPGACSPSPLPLLPTSRSSRNSLPNRYQQPPSESAADFELPDSLFLQDDEETEDDIDGLYVSHYSSTMCSSRIPEDYLEDDRASLLSMDEPLHPLPLQPSPFPRLCSPSDCHEGIYSLPLPGVRCPTCAKEGKEVWVIPGRACGYCGTACV